MQQPEIEIDAFEVFATGVDHPECVAFDQEGTLWAGGEAGQIYRIAQDGKVETVADAVGGFCAGLAFSPGDELLVCVVGRGLVTVSRAGNAQLFADAAGTHKLVTPNFGVFLRDGTYLVTDSGNWRKQNGYLLRFRADGSGDVVGGPFGYVNGLAVSADERWLYMVESDANRVLRFGIGHSGNLQKHTTFAENVGRFPDGLALDEQGFLYVSCYASDEVYRISPTGEKMLLAYDPWGIRLGSPTNMAFGVLDPQVIYVANLGRTTITRAKTRHHGQPLANQRIPT